MQPVASKITEIDSKVRHLLAQQAARPDCAPIDSIDTSVLPPRVQREVQETVEQAREQVQAGFSIEFYTMDTAGYVSGDNKNVAQYIRTAREYCPGVELGEPARAPRVVCSVCRGDKFDISNVTYICRGCGNQRDIYCSASGAKDSSRANTMLRYTYKRRIHFRDCVNQYQGKQNTTIPPALLDALRAWAQMYSLSDGNSYAALTKEQIMVFLKDTDNAKYYEDVNLIYRTVTGNSVDDIAYLEDAIMNDFDVISDLYDKKFKHQNRLHRKSFINKHYILFQLLRRHGHACNISDFNVLKTVDRKSLHEEILSELFDELGWNFTSLF